MKAFTYLSKDIDISIFNDVMTIYPTEEIGEVIKDTLEETGIAPLLGLQANVVSTDKHHEQYHKDGLDRTLEHFHLRFSRPIHEEKLQDVIGLFEERDILMTDEVCDFWDAYYAANSLPSDHFSSTSDSEDSLSDSEAFSTSKPQKLQKRSRTSGAASPSSFFYVDPSKAAQPDSILDPKASPDTSPQMA